MFDTSYYNYPTLKLISTFGLGIGMLSFFSGYGIDNLQTFGQITFNNLFSASETLSTSLNINVPKTNQCWNIHYTCITREN